MPTNGTLIDKKAKIIAGLKHKKMRDKNRLFVAEGLRLCETLVKSDFMPEFGLYTANFAQNKRSQTLLAQLTQRGAIMYETTEKVIAQAGEVETPQGIIVAVRQKPYTALNDLKNIVNPFFVVLDNVQDPGNVGTIIRTADAAGANGVIALKGTVDLFNGKTLRSAMGSHFHLPLAVGVSDGDLINFCAENNLPLYATLLHRASRPYYDADLSRGAIILGNEAAGVNRNLAEHSVPIHIPMPGRAESLNVAVAAAVIVFAAARQRQNM